MRIRRGLAAVGAIVAAVAIAACGASTSPGDGSTTGEGSAPGEQPAGTVKIVASTNVYGDIARSIAGDSAEITSIISDPAADPHSYEANAQNQLALSKADLVIENGGGYDDFVDTMLEGADNPSVTVLNAVEISGHQAVEGEELNEHVWYDLAAMTKLADAIGQAMATIDPEGAATYQSNAKAFAARVTPLEDTEKSIKAAHEGAPVAVTEPVPLYMLEAAGLDNKTPEEFSEAIEEGEDVAPAVLKETLDLVTDGEIKLIAYNEQATSPETEQLLTAAQSSGVAVVPVTETLPEGKDYVGWMTDNLTAIQNALG